MTAIAVSISRYRILLCMALLVWCHSVLAQPDNDAELTGSVLNDDTVGLVYTAADFTRFTPRNVLDILNRVPGFAVQNDSQGRGLGQASTNVLINGKRLSSKSQNVFDQLRRVTVDNLAQIEIVDGATLDMPGLSGQVANVVTRYGDISGRYNWRTMHRPKYAEPSWFGGEVSVNGSTESLEWNLAYTHGTGRGGAGGPGIIRDADRIVTEVRDVRVQFTGEFPKLSGSLTWNGPDDTVANLNVQYSRRSTDFSNDEHRVPVAGIDSFRDFDNHDRGYNYEVGGDLEFDLAFGTLKLIGLERAGRNSFGQVSTLVFDDDRQATGSRFLGESEDSERIGRSEYRWDMLGGNWEIDMEAAFNSLDQSSQFFTLGENGEFQETELPNGSGEVTEDRYEMLITHSHDLGDDLNVQLTFGGEKSELSQSGPRGLTRNFWRNKGSLNFGWNPNEDWDISLKFSRTVGQLSFGDFLASVSLAFDNENAGNIQLRPTQTWETMFQVKRNWGDWGSTNVRLYDRQIDDYIEIIPLPGGGESRGNIDEARLYGLELSSTVNLDPLGDRWEGLRLDLDVTYQKTEVIDQLTGIERDFSGLWDTIGDIALRHDVPGTEWAWGLGASYYHAMPTYRLNQVSKNYEGPWYTYGFIEHKDLFGLTVNLEVFNLTDGRDMLDRTVYDGLRTDGMVAFYESRDLSVQPIFRLEVTGNF